MAEPIPLPVASPRHPRPADGDTNPSIATGGYVKKKMRKYAAGSGGVGALVVAAMTWWFEQRGDTKAKQVDESNMERLVKVETLLSAHIDAENKREQSTSERFRTLEQDVHQGALNSAAMNAKLDMELDRHGVPKNRRPQPQDFEPAAPDGESK